MNLLILGATGGTGRQMVEQALGAGHAVTALARAPQTIHTTHDRLRVLEGDATDATAVSRAMAGQDAVISALGRGRSFTPDRLLERSMPNVLSAMRAAGIRRLVVTSAFGVGGTMRQLPFVPRLFGSTLLRGIYADKAIAEDLIRRSGLDWTIVQPSMLTDGPLTRQYRYGEELALSGMPKISRADVAHFVLDRLPDLSSVGKTLLVSY